jgi:hypothetical protein
MILLLRLLMFGILALVVWKVVVLVLRYAKKPKNDLKCATCRHCEIIDQDGVMCRYGDAVTLKTLANVNMCMDYDPGTGHL